MHTMIPGFVESKSTLNFKGNFIQNHMWTRIFAFNLIYLFEDNLKKHNEESQVEESKRIY